MPLKFNIFTGTLDIVGSASTFSGVQGPPTSTDKAIARWDGVTGSFLSDSKTEVQDGGAVVAQGFITRRMLTDSVKIDSNNGMIVDGISIETTGELIIEADGELVII